MKERVLVLYDNDVEYMNLMSEFLKQHKNIPWNIHAYSDEEKLLQQEKDMDILVVAESAYSKVFNKFTSACTIVLSEGGIKETENCYLVNKYQCAEDVYRELLSVYADFADAKINIMGSQTNTKIIGMYSPVRRCMQTSFALTMGQILAMEHRVLYMNFEHYAGLMTLLPDANTRDLADLLYFLSADSNKFELRLQTIVKQNGNLEYIPPMKVGQNLLTVTENEWMNLFNRIEEYGGYDYVILDLSENMQGLFDILRRCNVIFTLTTSDKIAESKMMQYEQLLKKYECEDVVEKSRKCRIPRILRLPDETDCYTKGELADYVRTWIKDI